MTKIMLRVIKINFLITGILKFCNNLCKVFWWTSRVPHVKHKWMRWGRKRKLPQKLQDSAQIASACTVVKNHINTSKCQATQTETNFDDLVEYILYKLEKFSKYEKTNNILAWIKKYISVLRSRMTNIKKKNLTVIQKEKLADAIIHLNITAEEYAHSQINLYQKKYYKDIYKKLLKDEPILTDYLKHLNLKDLHKVNEWAC